MWISSGFGYQQPAAVAAAGAGAGAAGAGAPIGGKRSGDDDDGGNRPVGGGGSGGGFGGGSEQPDYELMRSKLEYVPSLGRPDDAESGWRGSGGGGNGGGGGGSGGRARSSFKLDPALWTVVERREICNAQTCAYRRCVSVCV